MSQFDFLSAPDDFLCLVKQVFDSVDLLFQFAAVFSHRERLPDFFLLPAFCLAGILGLFEVEESGALHLLAAFGITHQQKVFQAFLASLKRAIQCISAGCEAALQDDQSKSNVAPLVFGERFVVLGLHIAGKGIVQSFFHGRFHTQIKGNSAHVSRQEKRPAFEVFQIFLHAPDEEGVLSVADGLLEQGIGSKKARNQQVQEKAEVFGIALVRRRCEEQQVSRYLR